MSWFSGQDQCLPETIYEVLSKAALTNNRTIEEEIIARLDESLGIDEEKKQVSRT